MRSDLRSLLRRRIAAVALAILAACASDPAGVEDTIDPQDALFAEAQSMTTVRLSWPRNVDSDVIQYVVERRQDLRGGFDEITRVQQVSADTVLYFDPSVEAETIYGYRITAINRFGKHSRYSIVAGVVTPFRPGIDVRVRTFAPNAGISDPDGYLAVVEGAESPSGIIGAAAPGVQVARRFSPLPPGEYRVVLRGLASNCEFEQGTAGADSARVVTVTDQGTGTLAIVEYNVDCRDGTRGEMVARVSVTGGDVDPDGFSLVGTGQAADQTLPDSERVYYQRIALPTPTGGNVRFANLRVGSYQVELDSVATNCHVVGSAVQSTDIAALERDTLDFVVDCPLGDIPDVPDTARPYVVRNGWTPATAAPGEKVRLDVRTDFDKPLAALELTGITGYDPTLLRFDSISGVSPWSLTPNSSQPGSVAWLLLNTAAPTITTSSLVRLHFTVLGADGQSTRTNTTVQSLSNDAGDDLHDSVRVVDARLTIAGGGGPTNQPPTAEANGPYTGTVGNAISFSSTGTTDADGTIASYSWNWGDQSAAGSGVSPTKSYATAGTYTVTLTVTDDDGATDTDQATVTVTGGGGGNQAPTAQAGGPYTGTAGVAVSITSAGSSDPDGTLVAYEWTFGDNTTGTGASVNKIYPAAGTYTVTLTVRDNGGLTATDQATVTIAPAPSTGPLKWKSAFGTINPADSTVQMVVTYDLTTDIPQTPGTEAVGTVIVDSLKWNPALLSYVAFNWGPGFSGSVNSTGSGTSGRVRFSGAQGNNGASGVVAIATITFKAIGPAGNTAASTTYLGSISSSVASGAVAYLPHTGVEEGALLLNYTGGGGPPATGAVRGTVTVAGTATNLAGVNFVVNPGATGAPNVTGSLTGSGSSFTIPSTQVQIGAAGDPQLGAGAVTLGSLPTGCTVTAPAGISATYSGLTSGGEVVVSFTVTCSTTPPPSRYVYKSTWSAISGNTVDLTIAIDPTGFNDPTINGAGPDGFAGMQAITALSGSGVGRLTAVSGVAAAPFSTPTVGGTLPTISYLTNAAINDPGITALANVVVLRFTIAAGAAGSVTTATTVQEISTPLGDAFNLVFTGAGQNIDVVEATLNIP